MTRTTIKKIAVFNLFVILFICADCFVVKPHREIRLFEDYGAIGSKAAWESKYKNNFLITTAGERIQIPIGLQVPLAKGDTLFLERTGILNRNLNIYFTSGGSDYIIPVGLLNDDRLLYKLLFPLCFILSILVFLPTHILKTGDKYLTCFIGTSIIVWIVSFGFYMFFY